MTSTITCVCAYPAGLVVAANDVPSLPTTLQRLIVDTVPDGDAHVDVAIDLGHLTALSELRLGRWQMDQEDLEQLNLPPNLVYLDGGVDTSAVSMLTHLTALRRLGGCFNAEELLVVMKLLPGLSHMCIVPEWQGVAGLGRAIGRLKAAGVEGVVRSVLIDRGRPSGLLSAVLPHLKRLPNLSSLEIIRPFVDSGSIRPLSELKGLTCLNLSLLLSSGDVDKHVAGKELLQLPAALAPLSGLCVLRLPQLRYFAGGELVLTPAECYSILDSLAGLSQLMMLVMPWDYEQDEEPDVYDPEHCSRVRTFVAPSFAGVLARSAFNVAKPQWE